MVSSRSSSPSPPRAPSRGVRFYLHIQHAGGVHSTFAYPASPTHSCLGIWIFRAWHGTYASQQMFVRSRYNRARTISFLTPSFSWAAKRDISQEELQSEPNYLLLLLLLLLLLRLFPTFLLSLNYLFLWFRIYVSLLWPTA